MLRTILQHTDRMVFYIFASHSYNLILYLQDEMPVNAAELI